MMTMTPLAPHSSTWRPLEVPAAAAVLLSTSTSSAALKAVLAVAGGTLSAAAAASHGGWRWQQAPAVLGAVAQLCACTVASVTCLDRTHFQAAFGWLSVALAALSLCAWVAFPQCSIPAFTGEWDVGAVDATLTAKVFDPARESAAVASLSKFGKLFAPNNNGTEVGPVSSGPEVSVRIWCVRSGPSA